MKSVSECKAIQAYLRHPGAELGKFVVGQLLVDHLGDDPDDLPVNSGLHNRDGEVIFFKISFSCARGSQFANKISIV